MRTAVVTVVHGRHAHLARQQEALPDADLRVVVAVDDDMVAAVAGAAADVVALPGSGRLPVARARNVGARRAVELGADALVFLDIDVIPGAQLLAHYARALARAPDALLSGPVAYLPPGRHEAVDLPRFAPHPARPVPAPDELVGCAQPELFWSLSFALTAATWSRIGGFDEAYEGYGGEDTDFAFRAAARGVPLLWVGGAVGYHQHHAVSSPPVEHVEDILRNGRHFFRTWGRWPMTGWLSAFEELGLVRRVGEDWQRVRPAAPGPDPVRRSAR